mmetsp:Transcript_10188/g.26718  ORF Transcript_10188/g.26718 Transcript_10188/m.26718 type:complete len:118 (+) Transcript_10188:545-898(+)
MFEGLSMSFMVINTLPWIEELLAELMAVWRGGHQHQVRTFISSVNQWTYLMLISTEDCPSRSSPMFRTAASFHYSTCTVDPATTLKLHAPMRIQSGQRGGGLQAEERGSPEQAGHFD